jgi:hypothetical protein
MHNLIARRISRNQFGTVSTVESEESIRVMFLFYEPANPIPAGKYLCLRGPHPIHGMCFELQNVPGHDGILIHIGNGAADTKDCLLPGYSIGQYWDHDNSPHFGIAGGDSKPAYDFFMGMQADTNSFYLTIFDAYPHNDL